LFEAYKFVLPLADNTSAEEDSKLAILTPLDYTWDDLDFMKKNKTLQLPENRISGITRVVGVSYATTETTSNTKGINRTTCSLGRRADIRHQKSQPAPNRFSERQYPSRHTVNNPRTASSRSRTQPAREGEAKKLTTRKHLKSLQFKGNEVAVRDVFPHNVVLMKDGTVVFCVDYTDITDDVVVHTSKDYYSEGIKRWNKLMQDEDLINEDEEINTKKEMIEIIQRRTEIVKSTRLHGVKFTTVSNGCMNRP